VSTPFRFWRSSCVVDVEVVAQGFAKMYLGLSWVPGLEETTTADTEVLPDTETETLTQIMEVSGNRKMQFVIPYKAASHWLRTDRDLQFASSITRDERNVTGRCNGKFTIYIINPLTSFSPSGSNNNPVTVFMSVSFPDLQVARPTSDHLCSARGFNYIPTPIPLFEEQLQVHASGSGTARLSETQWFGDTIEDILQLTRRPGPIANLRTTAYVTELTVSLFTTCSQSARPLRAETLVASVGNPIPGVVNFASWFANIFLTWRGEVAYHVVPEYGSYGNTTTNVNNTWDDLGVFITNSDAYRNVPTPYITDTGATRVNPSSNLVRNLNGTTYKPALQPDQPATALVPYYAENTFIHTIDPGLFPNTSLVPQQITKAPYTSGEIPGVTITVVNPNFHVSTYAGAAQGMNLSILASTGDNFSYGGLYPPGVTTDMVLNPAAGGQQLISSNGVISRPQNWIQVVP